MCGRAAGVIASSLPSGPSELRLNPLCGRAAGVIARKELQDAWNIDPRTYAIIGSAATLGGVVRVLISLTAIVTHTTSLSFCKYGAFFVVSSPY